MHSYPLMTVSALALLAAAPAVVAQEQNPSVQLGSSVRGVLDGNTQDYSLTLREGQGFEAILRSDDFDSLLAVLVPGELTEVAAQDDDGLGDGLHSRLRYVARTAGTYTLRVGSVGDDSGDFNLAVASWTPPRVNSTNVRLGQEVSGNLGGRRQLDEFDRPFLQYRLNLTKGQRIELNTTSPSVDTVLSIGHDQPMYEALDENDDYNGDVTKSRLIFTAPEAGAYAIRVSSLSSDGSGRITLKVNDAPPLPVAQPIEAGADVEGNLTDKSGTGMGGVETDRYQLSASVEQSYEINLVSDDFDSYLAIYNEAGEELASDDDGGGGLNSSIVFTPRHNGNYYIEARGLSSAQGAYRLTVDTVARPPEPVGLPFDQEIEGDLSDDDARLSSTGRYDGYVFEGTAGQRIQISMKSAEFDAFLEIGLNEEKFEVLASDDDGSGSSTDSRLLFELPQDGQYLVRARGLGTDERGAYELRLTERGPPPEAGSVMIGSTVRGSLSENDNVSSNPFMGESHYDDYRFKAKKDEKIRFTLIAPSFDAIVQVGSGTGESFSQAKQDDDSLSDTHARLNWTVPRDGDYVVRVTSFNASATGDYSLIVERQP